MTMRELNLASIQVIINVLTAALGLFFSSQIWNIVQILLLENILMLVIQIFLKQRDEDSPLSVSFSQIRSDISLWHASVQLFRSIATSRQHNNKFFNSRLINFLTDCRVTIDDLNSGNLKIDLRPGGFFFRETEAIQASSHTFWATSFVDPDAYWRGSAGARLLAGCKNKIKQQVQVKRIFIEEPTLMHSINDILLKNHEAGVVVKVASTSSIDNRLRRDFAIIDRGALAVELKLGDKRDPIEAYYYSPDTDSGRKAIQELIEVWHRLDETSTDKAFP